MATGTLTRAATAPVTRNYVLAPPPRQYARDDSSAERGSVVPLAVMQGSEFRNRRHHEPLNNDSPTVLPEKEQTGKHRDDVENGD